MTPMSASKLFASLTFTGLITLAGCGSSRTDTGYEPHRLSMNGNQIRGLYAPAFSPEAQSAKEDQKQTIKNVHPGPGGAGF